MPTNQEYKAKTKKKMAEKRGRSQDYINLDWSEELKIIFGSLVDLAVGVMVAPGAKLVLNEILTVDELAARLKVPSSTIEELARKGKLPGAFRVGKHWRFDLDRLRVDLSNTKDKESA